MELNHSQLPFHGPSIHLLPKCSPKEESINCLYLRFFLTRVWDDLSEKLHDSNGTTKGTIKDCYLSVGTYLSVGSRNNVRNPFWLVFSSWENIRYLPVS